MKKTELRWIVLAAVLALVSVGCSSDSDSDDPDTNGDANGSDNGASNGTGNGSGDTRTPDLVMITRIDDATGFMIAADASQDTEVDSRNGIEVNPSTGLMTYGNHIYTTGSLFEDKVAKYSFDGTQFTKEGEFSTGEGARAGSIIFASGTKAYVNTLGTPELLIFNPETMTRTDLIDLSPYALGENDDNPNASSGVIRDGKLFMAMAQIDTLQTWRCQAGASVLIINIETDVVEKHIQDDRACLSGTLEPNQGMIIDELGDIYVNHLASYGFYEGLSGGFLRIKAGAEEFDTDYYFNVTERDFPELPGGAGSYLYREAYAGDGIVYGNLFVPGLSSQPPNFVDDRQYVAYKFDLRNQTTEQLDIPATAGWSADTMMYNDKVLFGRLTNSGPGIYTYDPSSGTLIGDQTPSLVTEGSPVWMRPM